MQLPTSPPALPISYSSDQVGDRSSRGTIDDAATLQRIAVAVGNKETDISEHGSLTHGALAYPHLYSPSGALAELEKRKWMPLRSRVVASVSS
jgi:hypothetical protein